MTTKKRLRKERNKQTLKSRREVKLKEGAIIRLHRDIFFIPAGRYVFEAKMGNLLCMRVGTVPVGIPEEYLRFCSIESGVLREDEIESVQKRMREMIESRSASCQTEQLAGGGAFSIYSPEDSELEILELDS